MDEFSGAFESLEQAYFKAWRESDAKDEHGRQNLYLAANIVSKVRDHLRKISDDGKLAEREIEEIRKFGEPKKRFGVV